MDTNKPAAAAVLTEEEGKAFSSITDRLDALEQQTRRMVRELAQLLTEQRHQLLTEHRALWEAAEKKYGLDKRKRYEIVQSTREIVEHVCGHGPAAPFFVTGLGDFLKHVASAGAPAAPGDDVPPKEKLN